MSSTASNSLNHFLDTNVILRHANRDAGECESDLRRILEEAAGSASNKRQLWVSTILFSELRESLFTPTDEFKTHRDLVAYIRSITTVVSPDPDMALRAARLRDKKWWKAPALRKKLEKARYMSLGDSLHIVSALWVKETLNVNDLEFLTFDDGRMKSSEVDTDTKALSLLRLEDYTDGIANDPDVAAAVKLSRIKPMLAQRSLG